MADVVTILMLSGNDIPYAGVDELKKVFTVSSLERLVIAIFDAWLTTNCKKDLWVFYAMNWFTSAQTMRKLAKTVRYFVNNSSPSLALDTIEILAKYATETKDDMGLVYLNDIATQTGLKYKFREPARQHLVEVAHARRLTKNELQDRLVPSFDLNERGQKKLDYGARQFTVKLDETLMPYVVDADNKRLKSIPRLNKNDDQEKATQAKTWYKNFKKDIQKIANQQIKRLEHAMCSGQTWSFKEFEQFFVKHPLMTTLSQRVIWHFSSKEGKQYFRIAEDLTYLDINDDEIETRLIENQRISIVHPLLIDDAELGKWRNVLTDYEIIQSFEQLSRQCFTFNDEELVSNKITRFAGQSYYAGSLLALLSRGWENETDMEKFMVGSTYIIGFTKRVAGMIVEMTLTTGFHRDDLKGSDPQTIASVSFGDTKLANLQKIYPIQVSELLRDISLIPSDLN